MSKSKALLASLALCAIAAAPATKPTTRPVGDNAYPALQRKVAELTRQLDEAQTALAKLRAENAALQAKLEAWRPAIEVEQTKQAAAAAAMPKTPEEMERALVDKIKIGQTYEQVVAAIGKPSKETRDGEFIVRDFSRLYPAPSAEAVRHGNNGGAFTIRGWFSEDGKLADVKGFTERF
jgi:regulator of replication initiation timing